MESFDPTISKEAYALAARLIEEFDKMEVMVQGYVHVTSDLFPTLSSLWIQFILYLLFTPEFCISWLQNKYSKTRYQQSARDGRICFVIILICYIHQVNNML